LPKQRKYTSTSGKRQTNLRQKSHQCFQESQARDMEHTCLAHHPAASLELHLFGSFEIRLHGQILPPMRSRAGQRLFALLIFQREGCVSREWLSRTLWPDSSEKQSLYNLRRNLTDLRNALGGEACRILSPTPRTLQFDVKEADCDLVTFDAAIAGEQWEEAVRVYRGPLLQEDVAESITAQRAVCAEAFCNALEHLASEAGAGDDFPATAYWLSRLLTLDPYRETTVRTLMHTYSAMGESLLAVQTFRRFRLALHENQLGEPDAQTLTLYEAIPKSVGSGGTQRTPRPRTLDRGIKAPSLNRLPLLLNRLVGREAETDRLVAMLTGDMRLVTLTGAGGVGKTRLGVSVADRIANRFTDGAYFVDLAPFMDGALVPQTVARALGVTARTGIEWISLLQQHLGARSLLLLLDNCEQLTEGVARLAQALLQTCPGVKILTTSRQALGVEGESCCRVSPLSEHAATTLFLECAERAMALFPSLPDGATVQRIVRIIDCLPLAIEMAAAWTSSLPASEIAARLSDGLLSVRNRSSRTRPSRQQTLDKTLEWSYALLTEAERALLDALSVFRGGWTLSAAETICSTDIETLAGLVEKSLVVFEEDTGRYRLLETIREYAQRRLQKSGVQTENFRRHADYFLRLAEEAEKHLTGPQQVDWLNRLEADHDNLRMALTRNANDESGLRLASALVPFWKLRGYLREGSEWLSRLLTVNYSEVKTPTRARALYGAGTLAYDMGDFEIASASYQKSLAIHQEHEDPTNTAHLLVNLGNVGYRQGDYGTARLRYEEGLALYRGLEHASGIASALGSLGNIEDAEGNYTAARSLQEQSLALSHSLGDIRMTAYTLHNLANMAGREGDKERALVLYEESLALKRTLGDRRGIAALLNSLGLVAAEAGDHDCAKIRFTEAITLAQGIEDKLGMVMALDGLAWQAAACDAPLRAARLWGASARGHETLHMAYSQAEQKLYDGLIEAARQQTLPEAFATAWAEGHALLLEQAVREVLT
jgi:predicted ATPase/DNA-binding SARP family transcriptional activator